MKNLLNDFGIKKALTHISEEEIYALLQRTGSDTEALKAKMQAAKGKRNRQEVFAEFIENLELEQAQFCYRALRITYFFQNYREAFTGLYNYLVYESDIIPYGKIPDGASIADYVIKLYLLHQQPVRDYFIISLFTQQSKRYHQWRSDYCDDEPILDSAGLNRLQAGLEERVKKVRGSKYSEMRYFEHDGKLFVLFDFDDLPLENREFDKGKAITRYTRPSLEMVYAFDRKNNAVEVVAHDATIRSIMHDVCAKTLYNKTEISKRPPDNNFYDLTYIYELMTTGQPISVEAPEEYNIIQIFVESLRLRRTQFPFFTKELNINCSLSTLENGQDYNMAMPGRVPYEVGDRGFWERGCVEADHATLVVSYYNQPEARKESKRVTINSSGVGNLGHSVVDEDIKRYLRAAGILKIKPSLVATDVEKTKKKRFA